jgi:hypothetical protein
VASWGALVGRGPPGHAVLGGQSAAQAVSPISGRNHRACRHQNESEVIQAVHSTDGAIDIGFCAQDFKRNKVVARWRRVVGAD